MATGLPKTMVKYLIQRPNKQQVQWHYGLVVTITHRRQDPRLSARILSPKTVEQHSIIECRETNKKEKCCKIWLQLDAEANQHSVQKFLWYWLSSPL
ncbi:hypothetical protein V6N13_078502 [Hibiscus sabdariffa]|uniref:Uncharacterized protein n=1 Tax=Hibiscus sabdariffa TaxID=183260 RepID=A0ABR2RPH8_9ROSI